MMKADPASKIGEKINVPFDRIATFVRQVTHDVRNGLNAIDLQAAYVLELATDPDSTDELKRLRSQIQQSARALQSLSANFWLPNPSFVTYEAKIFIEDFRDRLNKRHPEKAPLVEWNCDLGSQNIAVDIEMIFGAVEEVFKNAFAFGDPAEKVTARAFAEDGSFILEIGEGLKTVPSDPEQWGVEPFVSTRRGGYGLGLFRTRMVLAAHGGSIHFTHQAGCNLLSARIGLPFAV